ncbi:MAG TPA: PaaI family thioesterase [Actinomycetota bacterium]|nr:PaaI family thioesterase [Actinomycetota bacterium]
MRVDETVRGSFAYLERPGLFALSGLAQLQLFADRRLPAPPLTHLAGLVVEQATEGASTWSIPAAERWRSAAGPFPGGALAFVADAALAGAIFTVLPPATGLASSDLSLNFLEPSGPSSERLVARGTVIHAGRRQALSEARIEDAHGRLMGHATSRCVLQALPFDPPGAPEDLPPPGSVEAVELVEVIGGEVVAQEVWDATTGLDVVRGWVAGDRPVSPACALLGIRFVDAVEGRATVAMPASRWCCTGFGTFYGGVVAALADAAINAAVTTTLPPGTSFGTLDLKTQFLRPVTPDGRDLTATATVEQRGRTIAVTTARIDDADGRRVAMATGSAMIAADRPWPGPRIPRASSA